MNVTVNDERRTRRTTWLVFTVIFFWIGLLMREDVSVCPVCKFRLNQR